MTEIIRGISLVLAVVIAIGGWWLGGRLGADSRRHAAGEAFTDRGIASPYLYCYELVGGESWHCYTHDGQDFMQTPAEIEARFGLRPGWLEHDGMGDQLSPQKERGPA